MTLTKRAKRLIRKRNCSYATLSTTEAEAAAAAATLPTKTKTTIMAKDYVKAQLVTAALVAPLRLASSAAAAASLALASAAAAAAFWAIYSVLAQPPARYVIEMSGAASAPNTRIATTVAAAETAAASVHRETLRRTKRNWRN